MKGRPATLDAKALRRVRRALDQAGYTRDNVRAALQTDQHLSAQPGEVVVFERRLAGGTPLEALMRFFLIGSTVQAADLEASLPTVPVAELERLGLAEPAGDGWRCPMRIVPHGDIALACDRNYYGDAEQQGADVVTGITSPATLLADLTIRSRVGSALDLGTGGGIQAMLLANHCERVVAVDINPRAIEFTELNACLNGFGNIEVRLGSWFSPVEGERFDIITANPPYVISPDSDFLYRDSGMPADSLCRQLVMDMPRFLTDGGFGHMLISWALRTDEEWSQPLRRWIVGLPCDVWLLHYLTEDPLTQAAKWNQPLVASGLETYGAAIDRWTEYYRRQGIDQIAFGAVILRRRSGGPGWVRADSFQAGRGSSSGLLHRVFTAEDFLRGLGDDRKLLDERFSLVSAHRLDQRLAASGGAWQLEEATLTLNEGIAFHGSLDIPSAQLLQHLDGRKTLKEAVEAMGQELALAGDDVEALTETALVMAKRLYQLGFVDRVTAS